MRDDTPAATTDQPPESSSADFAGTAWRGRGCPEVRIRVVHEVGRLPPAQEMARIPSST
jgi:hypothetical protein